MPSAKPSACVFSGRPPTSSASFLAGCRWIRCVFCGRPMPAFDRVTHRSAGRLKIAKKPTITAFSRDRRVGFGPHFTGGGEHSIQELKNQEVQEEELRDPRGEKGPMSSEDARRVGCACRARREASGVTRPEARSRRPYRHGHRGRISALVRIQTTLRGASAQPLAPQERQAGMRRWGKGSRDRIRRWREYRWPWRAGSISG